MVLNMKIVDMKNVYVENVGECRYGSDESEEGVEKDVKVLELVRTSEIN